MGHVLYRLNSKHAFWQIFGEKLSVRIGDECEKAIRPNRATSWVGQCRQLNVLRGSGANCHGNALGLD
jgi:hypothetical protein